MAPKHKFSLFKGMIHSAKNRDETWEGTSSDVPLVAIDAFDSHKSDDKNLKVDRLTDKNAQKWLKDQPIAQDQSVDHEGLESRIRLLICHETFTFVTPKKKEGNSVQMDDGKPKYMGKHERIPKYHMSQDSYGEAETRLALPAQTLPNLSNRWGTQSSEFIFDGKKGRKVSLDITMKTVDVEQLSRCGIALSHDFKTKTTRAFIRGINGVKMDNFVHGRNGVVMNHESNDSDEEDSSPTSHTLAERFEKSLNHTLPLWQHPLLLPVILLQHELVSIRRFSRKFLRVDANNIIKGLSIGSYEDMKNVIGGKSDDKEANEKRKEFTDGLNRSMCAAISVRRGIQAARSSASFLLGLLAEIEARFPEENEQDPPKHLNQNIKDLINSLDNSAHGFEVGVDAIISSLEIQLNLFSIVASQLDYDRGAEMAAQAGLDSVAMLTLAVVTAVFLPGTFIATIFSMSMFNWQAGGGPEKIVSDKFWIFWAAAIPLTICVLFAWWVWWNVSRVYYRQKFAAAKKPAGSRKKAFGSWLGMDDRRPKVTV